jgi:soluble cytochrome b562
MIEEFIEKVTLLLQGKIPAKIDAEKLDNENEREFGKKLNQLIDFMQEVHEFIIPLSKGKLHDTKVRPKNYLASPFKELHSRLVHLTWQATQVAKGDYEQRVDFMGDFSEAFNSMIVALDQNEKLLKKEIDELEKALSHIAKLEGILPICSNCKRIRLEGAPSDKQDSWVQIESYISQKTSAKFSHSICPECMKKLYPDFIDEDE